MVPFKGARHAQRANVTILLADAATYHQNRIETHGSLFGRDILARLRTGASTPVEDYVEARRAQAELRAAFEAFFQDYDLLLTPTTPEVAPARGAQEPGSLAPSLTHYTAPFNLTGLPALSIPCGFSQGGLPIGLQLVTRAWDEARLLQAGRAYESRTDWHETHPGDIESARN